LTSGLIYKFKVESRNSFGYSDYSDVISILCAAEPDQPQVPTSTVFENQVIFNWDAPNDNGTPITGYNIYFRKSDDTYSTEFVDCDGSDSTIITNTECTIPLATFTAEPFGLSLGEDINIKVSAYNAYGESPVSEVGGGAVIQLVPDAPINLANVLEITKDDRIGFVWEDGHSNGGNSIIDYQVWYDQGTDDFIPLATGLSEREYVATDLYSATTYKFKVRARNSVGYGEFSEEIAILAA
jgi:hypothetical protein